jgi:hypothetical protein
MDNAFAQLNNAYTWRGSVRKRPGARVMNQAVSAIQQQLFTRLRIKIGTTNGAGGLGPTALPIQVAVGQAFSCGDQVYTVNLLPTNLTLSTGAGVGTVTAGAPDTFTLVGGPLATDVFFYPSLPVMGLKTYDDVKVNDETLIAFDTRFAYEFAYATGWGRIAGGASTWAGTDADFFASENYQGIAQNVLLLFVTNNVVADAMRYWNGVTATWTAFGSLATTSTDGVNWIETCKTLKQFKGRLLLFNVSENIPANAPPSTRFINRIRFSAVGSAITGTAWRQDIAGLGGFLTIPVEEAINAVEVIKDRLIMFCENSTWELVYTNNQQEPFKVQQINVELGVESLNSIIPFDKQILGFGNVGIHACNGINVARIDELIPNEIFEVSNSNAGIDRVAGIRDYFIEVVYWAYQATSNNTGKNSTYPNKVLLYNYQNNTWATMDDSITAFGNYQLTQTIKWEDVSSPWDQLEGVWEDAALQNRFRSVIAGNQEGFTFIFDSNITDNCLSLQITNITVSSATATITAINHNLANDSYVYLFGIIQDPMIVGNMEDQLNDKIFQVSTVTNDTFTVSTFITALTGTYLGGGVISRVSQIQIVTKQFNFYNEPGMEMAVEHVDFLVDNVKDRDATNPNFIPAQIGVIPYLSSSNKDAIFQAINTNSGVSTGIIELSPLAAVPYEENQTRFWRRMYYNFTGETIQLQITWTDTQIDNTEIVFNDFQLNAMIFYVRPTKSFG